MKKIWETAILLGLIFAVTGCVDVNYIGEKYPPTSEVAFFFDEQEVPADAYHVMGRVTVSIDDGDAAFRSGEALNDALIEKAKEVGADAIVVVVGGRRHVGSVHSYEEHTGYSERTDAEVKAKRHNRVKASSGTAGGSVTRGQERNYEAYSTNLVEARFLKKKR